MARNRSFLRCVLKKGTIFVSDRGKSVYQLHIKCLRYFPFWQINWVKLLFRRDPWLFSSDRNIYHHRNNNTKWKHLLFFTRVCWRGEKHNKSQSQTLQKPVLMNMLNPASVSGITWLHRQGQHWKQLQVARSRQDPVVQNILFQALSVGDACVQVLLRAGSEGSSSRAL